MWSAFSKYINKQSFLASLLIINILLFINFVYSKSFSSILMYVHILSIILLWGFLFVQINLHKKIKKHWKEGCLILLLIFLAFLVRMDRLEEISPGMYSDEIDVAQRGLQLYDKPDLPPFISENYYHPTPLLYLTAFSVKTLGHTMTAIRMPNVIIGALTVVAIYILLRLFFPISISLFGAILLMFQYTCLLYTSDAADE